MFLLGDVAPSFSDKSAAVQQVKDMWQPYLAQREIAIRARTWTQCEREERGDLPTASHGMNDEGMRMRRKSVTSWLGLAVTILTQSLYVEGHRDEGSKENSTTWQTIWQPNGLDKRQMPIHRGAVRDGLSYASVMPGTRMRSEMP